MKYLVNLSEKADQDIRDIYEYIAFTLLAPTNAEKFFNRITEAILSLEEMPERAQTYKRTQRGEEIKFLVCGNHNIYFTVDHLANRTNVIRVLYNAMDIEKNLDPWI